MKSTSRTDPKSARREAIRRYAERGIDRTLRTGGYSDPSAAPAPSSSMLQASLGTDAASDGPVTRMHRSLPVLARSAWTPAGPVTAQDVNAAGMVRCERRTGDRIARDRCVEYQSRGCACPLAGIVRDAVRIARELEKEHARRAPQRVTSATGHRNTVYPPWALKCAWCGKAFEVPRKHCRKPKYDTEECARSAKNERLREKHRRTA